MSTTLPDDLTPRIAVLAEIARGTKLVLERLDKRLDVIETNQRTDFRWLVGIMLGTFATLLTFGLGLLDVTAHGFHWL